MPSACIHVDYLTHDWKASDVIRTRLHIRKQIHKLSIRRATPPNNPKDGMLLEKEERRLARFENALWRQMSRTCTSNLGRDNPLVHPSTVNWLKESDITWLYGPLYTDDNTTPSYRSVVCEEVTGLKPVLKKGPSRPPLLRFRQRHIGSPSVSDDDDDDDEGVGRSASFSSVSTAITSSNTHVSSSSSNSNSNVRFSSEITKIQYFLPESPVRDSFGSREQDWASYFDEYAETEDDTVWRHVTDVCGYVMSITISYVSLFTPTAIFSRVSSPVRGGRRGPPFQGAVTLLVAMAKSIVTLTVSWFIYHSMQQLTQRIPISLRPTNIVRNATATTTTTTAKSCTKRSHSEKSCSATVTDNEVPTKSSQKDDI